MTDATVTPSSKAPAKTQFVSITDAAELVGYSRAVLYNRNKAGKLAFTRNAEGKRVVDVSELLRCFGKLSSGAVAGAQVASQVTKVTPSPNVSIDPKLHNLHHGNAKVTSPDTAPNDGKYLDALRKSISLQKELAQYKESSKRELELYAARLDDMKGQVDDYRLQSDHWRQAASESVKLLEYHQDKELQQQQQQLQRGWLARLFGR